MPTFTIDGFEVPFDKGDTILRAAHRAGIDIPHYCWHPGLSVAANCRMCLVEIVPSPGGLPMLLDVLSWDGQKGEYGVERKPKLQPACQVAATEGMRVLSNQSPHVLRARHAVQEFLLLNHPVDCPICDQAGECKLQDYWLDHQKSLKRMRDEIVHKPKAVVFGPTVVYDAERCILCTRCVRFCAEVAGDPVLSIRGRSNLGEIIVSPGRQLDHAYSLMTAHVCPVGALTSRDFRFKARVWFLRSAKAICQGCATGCNAFLDVDPRTHKAYRYRPRFNQRVNDDWMCDEGILSYASVHLDRVASPRVDGRAVSMDAAITHAADRLGALPPDHTAVVLSAQHSNEDNFALATLAKVHLGIGEIFLTGKPSGAGDTILRHTDKNPNTLGATHVATTTSPGTLEELLQGIDARRFTHVIALGSATSIDKTMAGFALARLDLLVTIGCWDGPLTDAAGVLLPACSWAEATGTYVNAEGIAQVSERALEPIGAARPGWEIVARIAHALGRPVRWNRLADVHRAMAPEAGAVAVAPSER